MEDVSKLLKLVFLSTVTVVLTVAFFYVLYMSSILFLSALIGVGAACLLTPAVAFLKKEWSVPRFAGALTILVAISSLLVILFFFAGSVLMEQIDSLIDSFPGIMERWQSRWAELSEKYPKITGAFQKQQPIGLAQTTVSYIGLAVVGLTNTLTGLTLALVVALFASVNSQKYVRDLENILPESIKQKVIDRLSLSAKVLRKWFSAQLLDMFCVGALTTIGLWIAGVEYWALYGLLAGLLSIIPFVGIVGVVLFSGAIVAVLQPDKLIWLFLVFVITQQLEGNFILPKLMKDYVQVPTIPLIFLMILSGVWFGVLGVFVTPPLFAIVIAIRSDSKVSVAH